MFKQHLPNLSDKRSFYNKLRITDNRFFTD